MKHALLFDLDGTLIQSDPLHLAVFAEMFAERGKSMDEAFYMKHIHGTHNLESFPQLFPGEDAQALSDLKETRFRERLIGGQPCMPGADRVIAQAKASGWGVAIVTNAPRINAEYMLNAIGLRDAFETLIIGDECARGKPDPDPYLAAMRALDVAADHCIAFEDSPSGLRAARGSGAYTVGIRSSASDAELRAAGAHQTIADFNDTALPAILARLSGETV
ncbi:HAD family hydrolase [Tropicibacter oceani]|uniref:HAD family phosphatase n=1 Tax=Tropicibacter oceani TaxID=3058420 RepID=A0ABY8QE93_9RHOB|nr:HAD family phosphatase [Tropicibacter oceani]WGW02945.1 HAD family phosphatase [Tropicibacter oceani]